MSKEYYKKKIIDLRADIAKEKEQKKRDNERYAALIKGVSSPSSKASYRKSKIDAAASATPTDMSKKVENDDLMGIADDFSDVSDDDPDGLPF